MGDPKKPKKKYSTPMHPWNATNIEAERKIKAEYGLASKKEIYVAETFLKKYKNIAKRVIARKTAQGEKEKVMVLTKLQNLGLLPVGSSLDQILGLDMKDVLERRLQSVLYRKGLARSMKQARQFITHRHVAIGNKEISVPSYLVGLKEESELNFKPASTLASEAHPERVSEQQQVKEELEAIKEHQKKLTRQREQRNQSNLM